MIPAFVGDRSEAGVGSGKQFPVFNGLIPSKIISGAFLKGKEWR